MESILADALKRHASLSIIGMCKNAGKTTVLNRIIRHLRADPRVLAVTSIGWDGESVDIVTGTEKPSIWIRSGTLVATAADTLRRSDVTREILYATGMNTPLGEVVIFRALSDGMVELAGPSMNDQVKEIMGILQALGSDILLVDGATSRRTVGGPRITEGMILCAGASYHPDMGQVVADTAHICALLTLPVSTGLHPHRRVLSGAVTDEVLKKLSLKPGDEITALDGGKLMVSREAFERLTAGGVRFSVQEASALCCVCVNPFSATGLSFHPGVFRASMAAAVSVPVLDVKEAGCEGQL